VDVEEKTRTSRWIGGTEGVLLVLAGLGMFLFGYANCVFMSYLGDVDPKGDSYWFQESVDSTWIWWLVVFSLVVVASAGLPRRAGRSAWVARGSVAGAVGQGIGGVFALAGTGIATAFMNLTNFGPDSVCNYPANYCWPQVPQAWAMAVPGLLGGVVMLAMACLVTRLPWWIRATTPALLWAVAIVTQYQLWEPYMMPILTGPPR
jgi:hypothetical protein